MKEKTFSKKIMLDACKQAFRKCAPKIQLANPVMFVVYVGAILTTLLYFLAWSQPKGESTTYTFAIALILWCTVLFANFSEAIAEGRGRAQADTLKSARSDVQAKKLKDRSRHDDYEED